MTTKVVALYLLVLVLGAGTGVAHSYLSIPPADRLPFPAGLVFPDVILTALGYALLAIMLLVTAHIASTWGGEGVDIDLDV